MFVSIFYNTSITGTIDIFPAPPLGQTFWGHTSAVSIKTNSIGYAYTDI